MSQASFDSELFQPSLSERDDASGFDRPWNPMTLAVLTFFCGLIAGGGMLAINFRRLGMRHWFWPAVAIVVLASVAMIGGTMWYSIVSPDHDRTIAKLVVRVVNVLIALAFVRAQHRRFRLAEMAEVKKGSFWVPAIVATVLGLVATLALVFATDFLLHSLINVRTL